MTDDDFKLTRRLFLRHTAALSAVSAGALGIALKTDALSQQPATTFSTARELGEGGPYPYYEPQP